MPKRTRRSAKHVRDQTWAVVLVEQATFDDTPVIENDIVIGADWSATTGLERATLIAIRGWLSVTRVPTLTTLRTWYSLMYTTDRETPVLVAGTNGPADATGYVEDILWTYGGIQDVGTAGAVEMPAIVTIPIHVKAQRRITSETDVRIAFASSGTGTFSYSLVLRALVRRAG